MKRKILNNPISVIIATTLVSDDLLPVYVCVVDDEADLAYLFKDALNQIEGIEVSAFCDPRMALEHFRSNSNNYKVVVTDYRMPAITGLELLEKIKAINPSVTTILTSALEVTDQEECNCVDRFLQKPISMVKLIDEVEMLVNPMRVPRNTTR